MNSVQKLSEDAPATTRKEDRTTVRREKLRRDLVLAAESIVEERGWRALRARDVTEAAGCSLGALYLVFQDMDALLVAVKERTLDSLETDVVARLAIARAAAESPPSSRRSAELGLQTLADFYLAFAVSHPRLWRTIFEHPNPENMPSDAYMRKLDGVLRHIEGPLETLTPDLSPPDRTLWARALFSAVHGVVSLGLDQKLGPLTLASLEWQVRALVHAAAAGAAETWNSSATHRRHPEMR